MKAKFTFFRSKLLNILLFSSLVLLSCSSKEGPENITEPFVKEVSILSEINTPANGRITISAKGFKTDDKIILESVSDAGKLSIADIDSISDNSGSFILPDEIVSGTYNLILVRNKENFRLGSTRINITIQTEIPDLEGMTIKGIVHNDGKGIPGVVVSDGYEVTITNEKGIYYLPSAKKNGYVFISIPGNYEVNTNGNLPLFYQKLVGGSSTERKDFGLIPVNNKKHILIVAADWHLANRNDDLLQFNSGFIPDVNATISKYSDAGVKVYGIPLGDMTWDNYWYSNNFALNEYIREMDRIKCSMFHVMGNHDNDPYIQGDVEAEKAYRDIIGPTYYSFNLGEIHYVVLDNIEYINSGGALAVIGQRNYNDIITSVQMEWLKKDLATVKDKNTPVIIAMHAPLFSNPTLVGNEQSSALSLNNGKQFLEAVKDFSKIYVMSGHIHINYSIESGNVVEQNIGAVCATWWWTGKSGYSGNQICKDGTPGGYGIWEIDGKEVKWYYKSIGSEKDYQFRTYDLNTIHITSKEYAPNSTEEALAKYAGDYSAPNKGNEVLINVWGYGPGWSIEVKEGDKELLVERVSKPDPLHIISYEAKRLNVGAEPTSSFITSETAHMFLTKASSATSTLKIIVKDRFGNTYSETMERPKAFNYSMK